MGIAFGERSGSDGDNWTGTLIKERAAVFDGSNSRLRWGRLANRIDAAQMFRGQLRRRIFNQHQASLAARASVFPHCHFSAGSEVNQLGRNGRGKGDESQWSQ